MADWKVELDGGSYDLSWKYGSMNLCAEVMGYAFALNMALHFMAEWATESHKFETVGVFRDHIYQRTVDEFQHHGFDIGQDEEAVENSFYAYF